ncbi:hypothetical protein [Azospirillum sp. SYSU D00513]|uniref:hypothetical protein n=1 Tax=Azospirillum sp. SYSU D00513 TaxID=2812561 RepID=UPI001A97AF94|nr:hypothetical protein [Azospirillum sp. SYSU D00513]
MADRNNAGNESEGARIDRDPSLPEGLDRMPAQDTTGAARAAGSGQGEGGRSMTDAIDKAMDKTMGDLPAGGGGEEAERTRQAIDRMGGGNVPHGGDDPQHLTNTPMSPMPNETGGKGNVGDTPTGDGGTQR